MQQKAITNKIGFQKIIFKKCIMYGIGMYFSVKASSYSMPIIYYLNQNIIGAQPHEKVNENYANSAVQ